MEANPIPEPPPVPETDIPSISKVNRTKTTPVDLETMGSSSRSNGRSSIDSTSDRPKSQAGEADSAQAGSSGFSKLLAARRKKKKDKSQKQSDESSTQLETESSKDVQESRSTESRDGLSTASSVGHENLSPPDHDTVNLLTDDSEPDR